MTDIYAVLLALGSNIERQKNMPLLFSVLRQHAKLKLCAVSPIYESKAVGGLPNQPIYYNAAVVVYTPLKPPRLKAALREIEKEFGRVRTADKYAPRPIDIDIVMYEQQILELEGNRIPDPDLLRFPHIALPVADIAADWVHPEVGLTLRQIADSLEYHKTEIYQI